MGYRLSFDQEWGIFQNSPKNKVQIRAVLGELDFNI